MNLGYKTLDAAIAVVAFSISYLFFHLVAPLGYSRLTVVEFFVLLPVVASAAWLVFEWLTIFSRCSRPAYGLQVAADDVKTAAATTALLVFIIWSFNISNFARPLAFAFFLILIFLRVGVRKAIDRLSREWGPGKSGRTKGVLIIGRKERAHDVIRLVNERYVKDYHIIGCLDTDSNTVGLEVKDGIKVVGVMDDLEKILKNEVVDEVIFSMPLKLIPEVHSYIAMIEDVGAMVRIIPDWQIYSLSYQPRIASLMFEHFIGMPTMALITTVRGRFSLMVKETMDFIIAAITIILLSPILIGVAIAIKVKSPGPIIFAQERIGLNGRRFNMYKFRTMVPNAEELRAELEAQNEADGPVFKIKDDPRIIPQIGHFLRRSGLDELPQIFNVLAGQMSVVGPRPPIPGEVVRYEVPQLRRLSVKPGITCLWQCMPARNKVGFKVWVEKDLEYIDKWSIWLDIKILFKTAWVVLSGQGQ